MGAGTVQVVGVGGGPGGPRLLRAGDRLVFGRAPEADLFLGGDPWLPRRMGEIQVDGGSVRVRNLSGKFALHVESREEAVKLPAGAEGEYLLPAGTTRIGTAVMLCEGRAVKVVLAPGWGPPVPPAPDPALRTGQLTTQPRLKLNVETKEFMVALLLCRPWLADPTQLAPLPNAVDIAKEALRITSGFSELGRIDGDDRLRARYREQVRRALDALREKLLAQRLADARTELRPENVAAALLYYDVITKADLKWLGDADWVGRQEPRWWDESA